MIIAKVEYEGGRWEYKEFDDERSAAIFLIKNKDVKLRLAASTSNSVKSKIEQVIKTLKR
jgi:hypothetical protein